jgi:parvulin-like peptidyl-prolyl isomerase
MINGELILREEWLRQVAQAMTYLGGEEALERQDQASQQQVGEDVLAEMIDEVLIQQAAQTEGVGITQSQLDKIIEREIEFLGGKSAFDKWLDSNLITIEEYRSGTELQLLTSALREKLTSDLPARQAQVHLRHILLPSEGEAHAVLAELNEGAHFVTLAKRHSIDPGSREKEGKLGWLPRGVLPIGLDEIAWKLGPNERSEVIQSEFGFHIIEVIEQDPARSLSLDMLQTLQQQAWERWLKAERLAASIETWQTP